VTFSLLCRPALPRGSTHVRSERGRLTRSRHRGAAPLASNGWRTTACRRRRPRRRMRRCARPEPRRRRHEECDKQRRPSPVVNSRHNMSPIGHTTWRGAMVGIAVALLATAACGFHPSQELVRPDVEHVEIRSPSGASSAPREIFFAEHPDDTLARVVCTSDGEYFVASVSGPIPQGRTIAWRSDGTVIGTVLSGTAALAPAGGSLALVANMYGRALVIDAATLDKVESFRISEAPVVTPALFDPQRAGWWIGYPWSSRLSWLDAIGTQRPEIVTPEKNCLAAIDGASGDVFVASPEGSLWKFSPHTSAIVDSGVVHARLGSSMVVASGSLWIALDDRSGRYAEWRPGERITIHDPHVAGRVLLATDREGRYLCVANTTADGRTVVSLSDLAASAPPLGVTEFRHKSIPLSMAVSGKTKRVAIVGPPYVSRILQF
jgi:hypothetical protein